MSSTQSDSNSDADYKAMGFEAGESIHQFTPRFSKQELRAALFDSTYNGPIALAIETDGSVHLKVIVALVKTVYIPNVVALNDSPLGCWQLPDFYLEGWLLKSGFDPYNEVVQVRAILRTQDSDDGSFDVGYIQRVPASPNPDGPLVFA